MLRRRQNEPCTDQEARFAAQVVERAVSAGKLQRGDVKTIARLRLRAIDGFRHLQQQAGPMMACGAGTSGHGGQHTFGAFESQFKPGLDKAVGSFGIGAFFLSLFFAGLRAWLLNSLLDMAWRGVLNIFSNPVAPPGKAWQPGD